MNGKELNKIRARVSLSLAEFARALGYRGANPGLEVWRFEHEQRQIPRAIARLAIMFGRYGVPREFRDK